MSVTATMVVLIASTVLADVTGSARVIDGDTLEVAGERVRLYGIDAPELDQTCWDDRGEFPCGQRAKHMLWIITKDKVVNCKQRDTERYGRIVAVCYVGELDLGWDLVRLGWAVAYRRYSQQYIAAEEKARNLKMGLWQSRFTVPCKWRAMMRKPLRDPDEFSCE